MPRFALLEHDFPALHWDFFLEADDFLRSWRLLHLPKSHQSISAEPIANHRLLYLDYEGPVSGGRGQVRRVDAGTYEWLQDTATLLQVRLQGSMLKGFVTLRSNEIGWQWFYVPEEDR